MASRNSCPKEHIQGEPLHRHSSTSSGPSESASQLASHTRRGKAKKTVRVPSSAIDRVHTSPTDDPTSSTTVQIRNRADSRRTSATDMKPSLAPLEAPLTYTPTTHRVSKAKKGKRVHACEFPGCNKVFTRAEHRRRHELNHNPDASYACDRNGCRKAFHRPDLLQRHQERHDQENESPGPHRRRPSHLSVSSEATTAMTTASMASPCTPAPSAGPHSVFSITSIVNPPSSGEPQYRSSVPAFENGLTRNSFPFVAVASSDESTTWGYSERSQSPISDYNPTYPHRVSISSPSSVVDMYSNHPTPLMSSTMPGWEPMLLPPSALPSNMLEPEPRSFPTSLSEPTLPLPLSDLDGHEWMVIRRELSSGPGVIPGVDGNGIFDTLRWQNCLECYWHHFHPLFPVVHRPTFFATKPSPLMASAMVAIGSQYDTREGAKEYSLALLEAATKLLSKRDSITSRSRLTDLQTVFLLEVLSKYRSRRASVLVSPRFRSCYASLTQARHWVSTNPLALFKRLRGEPSGDDLAGAHKFWTEHETRRRILLASFILDTQQAALFEQPPALVSNVSLHIKTPDMKNEMPFPCDDDLWESSPIEDWVSNAPSFVNRDLPTATHQALLEDSSNMDSFQSRLILAHVMTTWDDKRDHEKVLSALQRAHDVEGSRSTQFSYHALLVARFTPIQQLLMVSGETWLFGKKVDVEADFSLAKKGLRDWVDDTNRCLPALWHATYLLRLSFNTSPGHVYNPEDSSHADGRLNMLHEEWSIYLAALVCWAVGFDASQESPSPGMFSSNTSTRSEAFSHSSSSSGLSVSTAHPPLLDPVDADDEMRDYLKATAVKKPSDLARLAPEVVGRTDGLLEVVRTRRLGGPLGELLNEAERVLYRLVEAKSRISF